MSNANNDFREKHILRAGDTIISGRTVYSITDDFVAYGGSAVIYSAESSEYSNKSPIKYIIKEVYPNEDLYERQSGVIQPLNPNNAEELKFQRAHIVEEHKLGGLCYNGTNLAVPIRHVIRPDKITINGREYSEDIQDGVFAVLDDISEKAISFSQMLEYIKHPKSEDHPLRNDGCPTLSATACLIEQVLLTLQAIHNQGILFGDIHMDNVWFGDCRLDLGIIRTACFMDFGCSRPLIDGKKTDIIEGRIYSSRGFIPPELLPGRWNQGDGTISIHADIFSVGCLMLRCLFPDEYWEHFGDSPVIGPNTLQRDDMKRLGIDNTLCTKVNKILEKAMHQNPNERYPSADQMLVEIQSIIEYLRPPKNKLSLGLSTLSEGEFLGRESELKRIEQSVIQNRNPIVVYGFPGMGKTELVIEYGRRKLSTCQVHFVRFEESFFQTVVNPIATAFSGYSKYWPNGQKKDASVIYDEVMHMLGEQSVNDFLIIDNVDSDSDDFSDLCDEVFDALCQLPMHLIITTRSRCEDFGIEVDTLDNHLLYDLINRFVNLPVSEMDMLIEAVEGHTLTVELIARSLKYSIPRITLDEIIKQLQSVETRTTSLARVATNKDRIRKKRRIEDHLIMLFKMDGIPELELQYMCNAFCVSATGIDIDLYALACDEFDQDIFNRLMERGWLRLSKASVLSVHPLIQDVTKKMFNLQFVDVQDFVSRLILNVNNCPARIMQVCNTFQRITTSFDLTTDQRERFNNQEHAWAFSEVFAYLKEAPSDLLIKIPLELIELIADNRDPNYLPNWTEQEILGNSFQVSDYTQVILGLIYRDFLASHEEHLELIERDKTEIERYGQSLGGSLDELFVPFSEVSAKLEGRDMYAEYLYLGKIYRVLGKLENAAKYLRMAWSMMFGMRYFDEKLPSNWHEEYIGICLTLGNVCVDLKDYDSAFTYFRASMKEGSATGTNNLGWMYLNGYGCIQDYEVAISLFERAASNPTKPSAKANIHLGKLFLGVHPDANGFTDIDPQRALTHLLKAQSLGAKDAASLISKAQSLL